MVEFANEYFKEDNTTNSKVKTFLLLNLNAVNDQTFCSTDF